jgi:hypothetical protein
MLRTHFSGDKGSNKLELFTFSCSLLTFLFESIDYLKFPDLANLY